MKIYIERSMFGLLGALFLAPPISSAQNDSSEAKMDYYMNQAARAYKENDLSFSCDLMRQSLTYARTAHGGKYYSSVANKTEQICNASLDSAINRFSNALKNHPYAKLCPDYRAARQACATAYSYDSCMSIKFGNQHKQVADSFVCLN
jgi:hypothetical protein